jgi:hypothetical protein
MVIHVVLTADTDPSGFSLPMTSRLHPIFDAIDEQRYDFAIKICNKAINKDPNAKDILTIQV